VTSLFPAKAGGRHRRRGRQHIDSERGKSGGACGCIGHHEDPKREAFSVTKMPKSRVPRAGNTTSRYSSETKENRLVGTCQLLERVETTKVPGATTSGLNRPASPSRPRPTFPSDENGAMTSLVSVSARYGWLVSPAFTLHW